MPSPRLLRLVLVSVLAAAPALAQPPISGAFTPQVGTTGQPILLTVTARQNVTVPLPCSYFQVKSGSPTGPVVGSSPCASSPTPLVPGQAIGGLFTTNTAGRYWFRSPVTGFPDQYFCVDVRAPGAPTTTIQASTTARIGQSLVLSLSTPNAPASSYVVAASLTSNTGIAVSPTVVLPIDPDPLFALSFPTPFTPLFANFTGVTNGIGIANNIAVNIPPDPALLYWPIKIQAAVVNPTTLVATYTNGLCFTIQP